MQLICKFILQINSIYIVIYFMLVILMYSKRKAVPCAQFAHQRMQIFSWKNLKNYNLPFLRNFSTFYFIGDIFFL